MIDKALGFAADAIMFDIEDGVAPNEKPTARTQIALMLDKCAGEISAGAFVETPARFVRVNAIGSERIMDDLGTCFFYDGQVSLGVIYLMRQNGVAIQKSDTVSVFNGGHPICFFKPGGGLGLLRTVNMD